MNIQLTFGEQRSAWIKEIDRSLAAELPPEHMSVVTKAMRYSALAPGKRLRPLLLIAAAQAGNPSVFHQLGLEKLLPVAVAVECIHVYSLIHDDLPCMDDDDMRRGQPTCHKVFGEAQALLAGDALLTFAFELLSRKIPGVAPEKQLDVIQLIAVAIGWGGMVHGQVSDLEAEHHQVSLEELRSIHRGKTGELFRAAVLAGATLVDATPSARLRLGHYADHFGLAFQIIDDILDVIGDSAATGKSSGSDERRGKATYVSLLGLEQAKETAVKETELAMEALVEFGPEADFIRCLTSMMLDRVC